MSYLVDTHIFLWSIVSPKKIPQNIRRILNDPQATKYVSMLSFWEISLKFSLNKIDLEGVLPDELPEIAKVANFDILDLDVRTASSYHKLPKTTNKDPFDRMLACQAIQKGYQLLTQDPDFVNYEKHGLRVAS